MRHLYSALAAALFLTLPCLLLQGAKSGYTVDANKTLETTSAMVEQRTLFPQVRVKQGFLPPLIHIPGHLWAISKVRPPQTAAHYADHLRWYDRRALMTENGLATGLTAFLMYWTALQLGLRRRNALVTASLYVFSSTALAYARYDYALPLAGLAAAGWMAGGLAWIRNGSRKALLCAGASLGLLILIRLELAAAACGALALVYRFVQQKKSGKNEAEAGASGWKSLIWLAAPAGLGLTAAFLHQFFYWGRAAGGYEGGFSTTPLAGLHGLLFSLGKSAFIYNPVLLLLPWAFVAGWRHYRAETLFVLLSLAPAFLIYAWWGNWWGGWGWGPRHLVPLLPLMFIPIAFFHGPDQSQNRWIPRGLLLLGALGLLFQLASMSIDFNQGILIAYKQLDQTAQHMGAIPLTEEEKELVTVHLWPWSGLSIHIQAALAFPFADWDIGLFQWAKSGPGGRGFVVLLAWLAWAASAWVAWRIPDDSNADSGTETA